MKIRTTLSWNPEVDFEQLDLVEIVLSIDNGQSQEFKGRLKRADTTMDYLRALYLRATKDYGGKGQVGDTLVEDKKGKRVYEIPVSVTGDELGEMRYTAERIQKKHFITTRNEWVTDEEYCIFFGSSGGLWNIERCDYPIGDFAESLRQTIYDMEHGKPRIYKWTNVPEMLLLDHRMKTDPEFAEFAEKEIKPLVRAYLDGESKRSGDIEGIKKQFNAIAEVAERNKHVHKIDRL